ncbi:MAG: HAD-IA family hydrolase [Candidatus Micrarchaeota archaeon]
MASRRPDFGQVRAVLFDIDDTLFPSSEFSALARENAVRAMVNAGLGASEQQARRELSRIISARGSNASDHFNLLARRFACPVRERVVAAGVAAYHDTKTSISPYPKAAELLLSLRSKGYLVGAASEGVAVKQWDKLIRLGLDPLFHHVFVTHATGRGKDPAFYRSICRQLKLPPQQVLMVGDNPSKDIAPAQAAGLRTVRVLLGKHKAEKSKAELAISSLFRLGSAL